MAVESIITGPSTSMSPLTAPAITADEALTFPSMTEPTPILIEPSETTSPLILAWLAYISPALTLPLIVPPTISLPAHVTLPFTVPIRSREPSVSISPLMVGCYLLTPLHR